MTTPVELENAWEVPFASIDQVLDRGEVCVVDLRSPAEFAVDHLPGAANVPLFDDDERALVGTLYKRNSPGEAFARGRELVVERIRALVERVAEVAGREHVHGDFEERVLRMTEGGLEGVQRKLVAHTMARVDGPTLVLHCWRGGMRSSSVVAFLRALGWKDVVGLEGGYKSYRTHVLAELGAWSAPPAFVIRGGTGVGKTLILREIERLRPGWTIDLEGLAGHRSSILGMVGLAPCSQKTFDSRMASRLRELDAPCVVYEGESRKVGDAIIPESVWSSMKGARTVYLEASEEHRVRVLIDDYLASDESRAELRKQLPFIEQRLGPKKWAGELVQRLDDGREAELVAILLERYYDPLYQHSEAGRSYDLKLDANDTARVSREIVEWVEACIAE